MTPFQIKNKFNVTEIIKGEDVNYQFNFTPKSFDKVAIVNKLPLPDFNPTCSWTISEKTIFLHTELPNIERKYRYCNIFEMWIRSLYYERPHKIFEMQPPTHRNSLKCHTGFSYRSNDKYVPKILGDSTDYYLIKNVFSNYSLPINIQKLVELIGFSPKYFMFETHQNAIIDAIYETVNVDSNPLRLLDNTYILHSLNIPDNIRKQLERLPLLVQNNDRDGFKKVFMNLVDDTAPITFQDLNGNIVKKGFEGNILHSNTAHLYNLFEALNNTEGHVVITPAKAKRKKYTIKRDNHVEEFNIVDQYNIFFKDESDIPLFFEVYQHYSHINDTLGLFTNPNDKTRTSKCYVHYFREDHTKIIQEKLKSSSLNIEISNRKTPYLKGCSGFIVLNSLFLNVDNNIIDSDMIDDITEYSKHIEQKLCKFGIDNIMYHGGIYSTNGIVGDKWIYRKNEVFAIEDHYLPYIYVNKLGDVGEAIKQSQKQLERYNEGYFSRFQSYGNIGMVVPITPDINGSYEHITRMVKRQKLTGNLGNFSITGLIFAPYSLDSIDSIEDMISAIKDV